MKNEIETFTSNQNRYLGYSKEKLLIHLKKLYQTFTNEVILINKDIEDERARRRPLSKGTTFMDLNFSREREQRTSLFTNLSEKQSRSNLIAQLKQKEFRPISPSKSPD